MAIKRKTTTAIVAGAAAAVLILGGTFAWTSISQEAKNETIVDINPGGRLHDDFNGVNKDVYVENFGDTKTGVPIFARIRLDEYMEIGPDAGINKDAADRSVTVLYPEDKAQPDINTPSTWITYIPGDEIADNPAVENKDRKYGYYWDWSLGNDDQNLPYYMPTFNKNKDSLAADINGTYEGIVQGDIQHYDDYIQYKDGDSLLKDAVYDWDEDTDEDYATETRDETTPFDTVDVLKKQETHDAKQISTTAEVITMEEWLKPVVDGGKGGERGDFWVYDTDGWAYWANPIDPGETTGLLLDGINMSRTPGDNWYYGINVVAQFATASDLSMFENPSDNAKELLEVISVEKTIHAVLTKNGTMDIQVDDGTGTGNTVTQTVDAYALTFANTRDIYEPGDTYTAPGAVTLADGDTGAEVVMDYYGALGKKHYASAGAVPWSEYSQYVTKVTIVNEIAPTSTAFWFNNMSNLPSIEGSENLNTENVTSMRSMFSKCASLAELDVTGWNTGNVTDTMEMFHQCAFETLPGIENWDVSKVEIMQSMFHTCSNLKSLDLSKWNTSSATNMLGMFCGSGSLETINLNGANWTTSKVTSMQYMFDNCSSLTSIPGIENFDTSNVTDMSFMFRNCYSPSFTSLDLSKWDVSSVTDMRCMFQNCSYLTSIDFIDDSGKTWDTSKVTNMSWLFGRCTRLATLDLTDWNTSKVTDMNNMFRECVGLTDAGFVGVGDFDVSSVVNMQSMFQGCNKLVNLDLSGWGETTRSAKNIADLVNLCSNLETINVSGWDTSSVTTLYAMFANTPKLNSIIGYEDWNVSNVTSTRAMFTQSGIGTLDLSKWATQTGKLTNMRGMFVGAKNLTSIVGIENWNVSNVTDMTSLFNNCTSLTVDCSGWTVNQNVTHENFALNTTTNTDIATIKQPTWPTATVTE